MAFLLNKTALSALRLHSQKGDHSLTLSRRGFHDEPGSREKAPLGKDPLLKRFKLHEKGLRRLKTVGDYLVILVVCECSYEFCVGEEMREAARKRAKSKAKTSEQIE